MYFLVRQVSHLCKQRSVRMDSLTAVATVAGGERTPWPNKQYKHKTLWGDNYLSTQCVDKVVLQLPFASSKSALCCAVPPWVSLLFPFFVS